MRALLDTNIVIHRENTQATSLTIGKFSIGWINCIMKS